MKSRYAGDLAPEQVFDEANRLLARDRAKLGSTNAPIYKGQSISPMSTLTQRARGLQNQFNTKAAPYSNKLGTVLSRPNQINPQGMQYTLNNLGNSQQNFNQNILSRILGEQYRGAYNPERFSAKSNKDIGRGIRETGGALNDIGRSANVLEQSSNQALAQRLQGLQGQKQERRKALVGNLEQFGNQKHGYNNLVNAANKNAFEQEANAPFRRMELLQQSLGPLSQSMGENVLPEIKARAAQEALQALRAYGVDTNKPVSEWENARMGTPPYPGQLVANLPPEILASHNTLEAISPKFRGTGYEQSKNLLRDMMANPSVGERALAGIPERMRPQTENLENAAQKRLKRDLAAINNQFIQANQFGSPLHLKTAEDRARELSKATLEQRSKLLEDTARSELSLGHQQQQANLRQVGLLGDEAQKEYQNMLNAIRSTNNLGATRFANEQAENEDLYKNYQNEAGWEWPHLRGSIAKEARVGALGDVFRGLESGNVSLDQLAGLNTNYSESQKELQGVRDRETAIRGELQTERNAKSELQRQLGTLQRQQQEAQRTVQTQAEAQRQAQEQQRLAQQQSAQAAEAQRLAALRAEAENTPPHYRLDRLTPDMLNQLKNENTLRKLGAPLRTNEEIMNSAKKYGFVPIRNVNNGQTSWGKTSFDPTINILSSSGSGKTWREEGIDENTARKLWGQNAAPWRQRQYQNGTWI